MATDSALLASQLIQPMRSLPSASLEQGHAPTPDHTSHDYLLSSPARWVCLSSVTPSPSTARASRLKGSLD